MYGWTGNILHINLTTQNFKVETPGLDFYKKYLGGKGMGGYYLRKWATLPFDHPNMVVSLFAGPLVATIAPTSGRAHLISKSPLTGLVGDASLGGKLATQLKRAGWDGMVITGKSPYPIGIQISNSQVKLCRSDHLWGLDTKQVHQALSPKKAGLACIGPAGENGVRFASVTVDQHHAAGRSGLGLCFGVKNLKYLLVEGRGHTRIKDPKGLKEAREEIIRLGAASPALMGQYGFSNLGTGAVYDLVDSRRMMPTDNFRATRFENAAPLNAAAYLKTYTPKKYGCKGCHILCKKIAIKDNRSEAMPEFETMSHFTALIGCRDTDLVVEANDRCNRYGMDTISAAVTLAARREITGQNYTENSLLSLLDDMALNQGEGKILNKGSLAYAHAMGNPGAAMAVKGMELPAYDPRGAYGMALGYALSTRGGCHLRAYPISHEIFRKPVATDRFSFSGKARIIKIAEDINAVVDSLTACKFIFFAAGLEEYAKAYTAVTGEASSAQDLVSIGERIYYNERIINCLNGFDVGDDDLPQRFFNEPGTSGNQIQIPPIDREAFLAARKKYYDIRGLDTFGKPLVSKSKALGLEWSHLNGQTCK
ncbi:MAG: aldehyde ferredoxin oxidoreductase family protein [Desulfobacteraceae bacterium]|nr:aldehyde ferredoxin oxidoreductase family protein [Desulfobacteraceae bacterium]